MTLLIDQKFSAVARELNQQIAIGDGRNTLSFKQVEAQADRLALLLSRNNLQPAEPVMIMVSNDLADIPGFLGIWRAGGVAVPVHRTMPQRNLDRLQERLGNRFLVDGEVYTVRDAHPPLRPLLADAGTIIFTSGSTGEPKGVVLSAERASAKLAMIETMLNWQVGENSLIGLQLTFSFGQWATWLTLLNGGMVHLRSRFNQAEVEHLLDQNSVQRFPAVPTMLRQLAMDDQSSNFKGTFLAGGEVLPPALGRKLQSCFPDAGLGDIFGLTETGTSDFFVMPSDYGKCAGTIGRAGLGINYRISPDTNELHIHSPWRMLGYLDAPELTAMTMKEGWFATGDLAREEEDGSVRLIGRAKDLIVRAGNKISPLEIENVFLGHEGVSAALAVGVADDAKGEAIHLAITMRGDDLPSEETLRNWAEDYLERFKIPDRIHFMEDLPSGRTGKLDRGKLRALLYSRAAV